MRNPFSDISKLFKTEKVLGTISNSLKGMTMKNWKTGVCGTIAGLLMLAKIWAPPAYQSKINDTTTAFIAMGLLSAKDYNVTGGTK